MPNGWEMVKENVWQKKDDEITLMKNCDEFGNLKHYNVEIFTLERKDSLAKWLEARRFRLKEMATGYIRKYIESY